MEQARHCGLANAHQRVEVCVQEKGENVSLHTPLNSMLLMSVCVWLCCILAHYSVVVD